MNIVNKSQVSEASKIRQIWHFVVHLRLHYQLFILSGPFLLGALLRDHFKAHLFLLQFLNVHFLLFGGATAFNSYWDKDDGPIGGLKHPPDMDWWMQPASLILQLVGLGLASLSGLIFAAVYAMSMFLFWLYSTPAFRWKGKPVKSLFAIGISTGFNAVMMGYLADGSLSSLPPAVWVAALGATLVLLSLYPVSQVYQQEEDATRGDQTFVLFYGSRMVYPFFQAAFLSGLILLTTVLFINHQQTGLLFGLTGLMAFFAVRIEVGWIVNQNVGYSRVMQIKYLTSLAFELFIIFALIAK